MVHASKYLVVRMSCNKTQFSQKKTSIISDLDSVNYFSVVVIFCYLFFMGPRDFLTSYKYDKPSSLKASQYIVVIVTVVVATRGFYIYRICSKAEKSKVFYEYALFSILLKR